MALTNDELSARARVMAHESWAATPDRAARTLPARQALLAKFEREVDPNNELDPDERARRAEHKRKAHYSRLQLKSAASRRKAADLLRAAEAAEAELREVNEG